MTEVRDSHKNQSVTSTKTNAPRKGEQKVGLKGDKQEQKKLTQLGNKTTPNQDKGVKKERVGAGKKGGVVNTIWTQQKVEEKRR